MYAPVQLATHDAHVPKGVGAEMEVVEVCVTGTEAVEAVQLVLVTVGMAGVMLTLLAVVDRCAVGELVMGG